MTIEDLGLTREEMQERVIENIATKLLTSLETDEDGGEFSTASTLQRKLQSVITQRIDTAVNAIAEKHILPNVSTYLENFTLQKTSQWGEKIGGTVTFIEYLTQRAEAYLNEKVDYDGKDKAAAGGYSWTGTQSRLTSLVHKHLHYSIEESMKNSVNAIQRAIAPALAETVKLKLEEISKGLRVAVEVKR